MSRTRSLLSQLVPPLALRAARRLAPTMFATKRRDTVHCSGAYATYDEARAAAGEDYEDPRIIEAVFAKTLAYRDLLTVRPLSMAAPVERVASTLFLVGAQHAELRVIDFGGAFGTHYWIAKAVLGKQIRLRWHVVETAAMCARATQFANEELRFFSDLDEACAALGEPDLVYSDGVLHALPDPLTWLRRLVACRARYLCVRRIGTATPAVFTVLNFRLSDHEPEVPLPVTVRDAPSPIPLACTTVESIEATLCEHYALRCRFGGASQTYHFEAMTLRMHGYFCDLSSGQSLQ